ncbi:hypothetical protein [Methanobacterium sp. MBAC-LM]|uniref:hypothetical protein n=1 Tax=Methanobacterium sp. MBAC-LM TaxID=3412034 RepID=UPI003C70B117
MKISKPAEKTLQKLWIYWVYLEGSSKVRKELHDKTIIKELENLKLIEPKYNEIYLTPEGFEESKKIIEKCKLSEKSKKLIHEVLL